MGWVGNQLKENNSHQPKGHRYHLEETFAKSYYPFRFEQVKNQVRPNYVLKSHLFSSMQRCYLQRSEHRQATS